MSPRGSKCILENTPYSKSGADIPCNTPRCGGWLRQKLVDLAYGALDLCPQCLVTRAQLVQFLLGLFLYMVAFMDTVATIPTGSMAERWKWGSFVVWGLFHGVGLALCATYRQIPGVGPFVARLFEREPLAALVLTQVYAWLGWLVFFYPVADALRMARGLIGA